MRRFTPAIFAIAATILATASCDSEQPATSPDATASLTITARADVEDQFCWDLWEDQDNNGECETDTTFKICEVVGNEAKNSAPVPWRYSAQVSILRAGETTPQIIASSVVPNDTIPDFVSLTPYDTLVEPGIPKASADQRCYLNAVRVSRGSPTFIAASFLDLGIPNILEQTPDLEFQLSLGDTVIVEARKQAVADAPNYLQDPSDLSDPNLVLTGVLRVGSGQVLVNGTSFSSSADKAGFSFSYTRR